MKVEKMIMAKYGLRYGDANKVVKLARQRLGIAPSVVWTEELEAEAHRLCDGEMDGDSSGGAAPPATRDAVSTAPTSASSGSATPAPAQNPLPSSDAQREAGMQRIASDEIGCWTVQGSSEDKPFVGRKTVADLQHGTLLEGPEVGKEGAPKLPVRRCSDPILFDGHGDRAVGGGGDEEGSHSSGYSGHSGSPMPQIRPLRRTDNRTKHA